MDFGKLFLEKKIIIAAAVYFFISGILLYKYGIQLSGEAEKYIDNANRILHQQELRNGFFGIFYFAYSLIVSFFIRLSVDLVFVAIVQIVVSFIAAISLYKILLHTLENKTVSFLFFCAYLLCYPIQKWNYFLYSESIHTSFLVIGIYLLLRALQLKKITQWMAFGLMALAIIFSRPVGIIFLFSFVLVLIAWLYRNDKRKGAIGLSILGLAAVIGIMNTPITSFINPDSLKRMEIICQLPESNANINYQEFNKAGLYKAYLVIKNEIGMGNFFMTGFKKLGSFFGMYRGYYSWQNNLLLLLHCIFYPFVILGIFSKQKGQFYYIRLLSILYLLFTTMAIFFTCDDWANRFISPAFPFILILAASGFLNMYKKLSKSG